MQNFDESRLFYKFAMQLLTHVPRKVRIFAWRVALEGLATQGNRRKRRLVLDGNCVICGVEEETAYHAVVRFTKARAFRQAVLEVWSLPPEKEFDYTDPD